MSNHERSLCSSRIYKSSKDYGGRRRITENLLLIYLRHLALLSVLFSLFQL
jgi:hypothetical protein